MSVIDKYNARSQFAFGSIVVFTVCFALTLVFRSSVAVVACICIAMAGISIASGSSTNTMQNTMASDEVATAVGFYTGFAYIVSSIFPYAMGALYTMTGTLDAGFYMIITAGLIGISATHKKPIETVDIGHNGIHSCRVNIKKELRQQSEEGKASHRNITRLRSFGFLPRAGEVLQPDTGGATGGGRISGRCRRLPGPHG
jgi:hypothetical protein